MPTLREFVLVLGAVFYLNYSSAQDFIIDHDLEKDETRYFKVLGQKDTIKVKKIIFNKQGRVILKIENFNPFYWRARVSAERNTEQPGVGTTGLFNPFSFLAQNLGGLMQNLIPGLNLPDLKSKGSMNESAGASNKYIYQVGNYQELYSRFESLVQKSDNLQILTWRLNELKYDHNKSGSDIKLQAQSALVQLTGIHTLTLEGILSNGRKWNRELIDITDSLILVRNKLRQLEPQIDKSININDFSLEEIAFSMERTSANLAAVLVNVKNIDFVNELSNVAKTYNEIQAADFKYSFALGSVENIAEVKLQLTRSDSTSRDTITKYFPVKSRGNFKLRNSVGLSFTYFEDKNRKYFVTADTTIGSSRADLFTPVISVFIHFYGVRNTGFKLGGGLGFGIPITGEENDINYLLGLSSVLGKNEPIFISAGITGTKVLLLDKGWKTGDKVRSMDFVVPSFSAFRIGGFLSFTFNLSQVLSNKKED